MKYGNAINKFKKGILLLCISAFCWNAYFDLLGESKNMIALFKKFYGLSASQKKAALFGKDWLIIDKISRIIPQDSKILLQTADDCEMFYSTYALFPRKVYTCILDPDFLSGKNASGLNWEWLKRKQISWIVLHTSEKLVRVIKIADGKIIEEIRFSG